MAITSLTRWATEAAASLPSMVIDSLRGIVIPPDWRHLSLLQTAGCASSRYA
jgi:hypothetical protein